MRSLFLHIAAAVGLTLALLCFAPSIRAQTGLVDGQVIKVDEPAKKITIKHGPLKKFEMDEAMTMVYVVQDPAQLKQVNVGDKVKFDAERINGRFTIAKILKTK
jgi:Cu(I)/Ag(I) efflux system periplasmic protein CusF